MLVEVNMQCNGCGNDLEKNDVYCSQCGKISYLVKQNAKGQMFVRLDKIIPVGIYLIIIGLLLLCLFIIFFKRVYLLFGLSLAICSVGIVILSKYKDAVNYSRMNSKSFNNNISKQKCGYCYSDLRTDGKYCTLCGSKYKQKRIK